VYFFEDAPKLAEEWASMNHPGHETCVLEAEIALSHCLDLMDGVGSDLLEPFYGRYVQLLGDEAVANLQQPKNDAFGDLDCGVINLACETVEEDGVQVDVVRAGCRAGGAIYGGDGADEPRSRFDLREHVQLAVRNNCAILSVQRTDPTTGKQGHESR
jgi:hypothetical protein